MGVLDFPNQCSVEYPDGYASAEEDYECLLVFPPLIEGGRSCMVPGSTHEQSSGLLAELREELVAKLPGAGAELAAGGAAWLLEDLVRVNVRYLQDLDAIEELWHSNGKQVNGAIATLFDQMNRTAVQNMRAASVVPSRVYQFLDSTRELVRRRRGEPSTGDLLQAGEYGKVIRESFTPAKGLEAKWIRPKKLVAKMLRKTGTIGTIVAVVETGAHVRDALHAQTDEAKQAALLKAAKGTGDLVGSAGGTAATAALCIALGAATGGLALLGCGVLGGVAGGVLGGSGAEYLAKQLQKPAAAPQP